MVFQYNEILIDVRDIFISSVFAFSAKFSAPEKIFDSTYDAKY